MESQQIHILQNPIQVEIYIQHFKYIHCFNKEGDDLFVTEKHKVKEHLNLFMHNFVLIFDDNIHKKGITIYFNTNYSNWSQNAKIATIFNSIQKNIEKIINKSENKVFQYNS